MNVQKRQAAGRVLFGKLQNSAIFASQGGSEEPANNNIYPERGYQSIAAQAAVLFT